MDGNLTPRARTRLLGTKPEATRLFLKLKNTVLALAPTSMLRRHSDMHAQHSHNLHCEQEQPDLLLPVICQAEPE